MSLVESPFSSTSVETSRQLFRQMANPIPARQWAPYIGPASPLASLVKMIEHVAPTSTPVLIQGETGTGKEWLARLLHDSSPRDACAFIAVNCAAVPGHLFESEFFGHARGAFTGAFEARGGLFGAAHRGTLFLDEVGEMPFELQAKLLRVLECGRVQRLGETTEREVDIRIVAATNRRLEAQVADGTFRKDLFYRLSVISIDVPPLRERAGDIEPLMRQFIQQFAQHHGLDEPPLPASVLTAALDFPWPGNVRELRNHVERAVLLGHWDNLDNMSSRGVEGPATACADTLVEVERRQILRILARTCGKIAGPGGAAELLGLHPNTLRSRMKKLGLRRQWMTGI